MYMGKKIKENAWTKSVTGVRMKPIGKPTQENARRKFQDDSCVIGRSNLEWQRPGKSQQSGKSTTLNFKFRGRVGHDGTHL